MGRRATRMLRGVAAAAAIAIVCVAALPPVPAAAQAMRVGDLGTMPSPGDCLATAEQVLTAYIAEFGGHATSGDPEAPDEWAIYGWGLRPGINDVVITCPAFGGRARAFYTVHALGEAAARDADTVAGRVRALWERLY